MGNFDGFSDLASEKGRVQGTQWAVDNAQNVFDRKNQQEKWDIESQRQQSLLKQTQIKTAAQAEIASGVMNFGEAGFEQVKQKLDTIEKRQKEQDGGMMRDALNNLSNSFDKVEGVKGFNTFMKQNPAIMERMEYSGKGRALEPESKQDRAAVANYLSKTMDGYNLITPEKQEKYITRAIKDPDMGFIMDNGELIDIKGLSITTGAAPINPRNYQKEAVEGDTVESMTKATQDVMKQEPLYDPAVEPTVTDVGADGEVLTPEEQAAKAAYEAEEATRLDINPNKPETVTQANYMAKLPASEDPRTPDLGTYKTNEGYRGEAYQDSEGHWTIGYGHKIKPGEEHLMDANLSKQEAEALLVADEAKHTDQFYKKEQWAEGLKPAQKAALEDMSFNMGPNWMDKFPSVRKVMQEGDFDKAAKIIRGSKYADQVGARADRNATAIAGGEALPADSKAAKTARDTPYNEGSMSKGERMATLKQLAGYSDLRPAAQKTMDFLASKMDNPTLGEVTDMYQETRYKSTAGGGNSVYAQRKRSNLENYKAGRYGEVGSVEAMDAYHAANDQIDRQKTYGTKQIQEDEDTKGIKRNRDLTDKYNKDPKSVTDREMYDAIDIEQSSYLKNLKAYKDNVQDNDDSVLAYEKIDKLNKQIASIPDEDLQRGLVKGSVKAIAQYIPAVGEMFTDDYAEKFAENLNLDSKAGMFLADYIKSVSGLAVTDAERQILTDIAGLSNLKDPVVLREKLSAMQESIAESIKTRADKLGVMGASGSQVMYMKAIEGAPSGPITTKQPSATEEQNVPTEASKDAIEVTTVKEAQDLSIGTVFILNGNRYRVTEDGAEKL